jgi:hypothetical protein
MRQKVCLDEIQNYASTPGRKHGVKRLIKKYQTKNNNRNRSKIIELIQELVQIQ